MNYMDVPIGATVPFLFDTFAGATGASITISGFDAGDVKIKKDTSLTAQPTLGSGIVVIGADGIDEAGVGIHGFSINTGNTTDAGYFAVGSYYNVIVDAITVDAQPVRFIAGAFRLIAAETQVGYRKVDAQYVTGAAPEAGTAIAAAVRTNLAIELARIDVAISTRSTLAAGAVMALDATERNAIATAHMALIDGVATGYSPGRAQRIMLAALAGKVTISGATVTFRDIRDLVNAITATTTVDGQRSSVSIGIT